MYSKSRIAVAGSYAMGSLVLACVATLGIPIALRFMSGPAHQIGPVFDLSNGVTSLLKWYVPPLYWVWTILPDPSDPGQFPMMAFPILGMLGLAFVARKIFDHGKEGAEIIRDVQKARRKERMEGKRARQSQSVGDVSGSHVYIQQHIEQQTERLEEWGQGFLAKFVMGVAISVVGAVLVAVIKQAFALSN